MLLVLCHAGATRYAVDSRHVSEVLPRLDLHRLTGSPAWLAGLLIYRGAAIPVVDLVQLTEGRPCPDRLSSRMAILQTEIDGIPRRLGLLAEHLALREIAGAASEAGGEAAGATALGKLLLDEEGVFQLIDLARLVSQGRQAFLFTTAEK